MSLIINILILYEIFEYMFFKLYKYNFEWEKLLFIIHFNVINNYNKVKRLIATYRLKLKIFKVEVYYSVI